MSCDSKSYNALKHISQTILQQVVEVNKSIAEANINKEFSEEQKNQIMNFCNYHLLVLSILLHDAKFVAEKEFPDAAQILLYTENVYKNGIEQKFFTPCKCPECNPEVQVEVVEQKLDNNGLES